MPISSFVVHLPDKNSLMDLNVDNNYLYNLELFYSLSLENVNFMVIGELHDEVAKIIKAYVFKARISTRGKNLNRKKDTLKDINFLCKKEVNIAQNIKILCSRRFDNKRILDVCPTHTEDTVLLPDGTMALCSMDGNMQHLLGNLYNNTYEEIMNDSNMNRKNSMMCKNSDKILCRDCDQAVDWNEKKWETFKKTGFYA
jgi:radical SAM protein with 4Fe4S-binding SPASM domain